MQRIDAPMHGVVHVHIESRLVELDDVHAIRF
jgi:hypothetical protein